jgi:hypothetical protein
MKGSGMNTIEKYVAGFKKAYIDNNAKDAWGHFEDYLKMLIDNEYDFINEDTVEE